MIPETSVNWKAFEYKFSDNPQRAFENLTYYLFCNEYGQKNGIFRYFNQPHIETNPIQVGDKLIGFQAKYYAESVAMSSKEEDLRKAVEGASKAYPGITTLYFYISREFSSSSEKDKVKPAYQTNIENIAKGLGITIEWKGLSNIEAQLMQDKRLTICRNVFFQVDSAVQECCESLKRHKEDIFNHIRTEVSYKDKTIALDTNNFNMDSFLKSNNQILVVDGEAGTGKSALIKKDLVSIDNDTIVLAFRCTDMDVSDKRNFLLTYGSLVIDEVLKVYEEIETCILYIDAVEKYFILENQNTFEDLLQMFVDSGWKIILTIRTAYMESFHNLLLNTVSVQSYHVNPISKDLLYELSVKFGFVLPSDKKLIDMLRAPFYLGLYLTLDNIEDVGLSALNREAFEEKIWDEIIRNNKRRKNNLPTRREDTLVFITKEMLKNESYSYMIKSGDDHDALFELEQTGVIIQSEDAKTYYHGHDVFEELVVNHIFTEQYKNNIPEKEFFEQFGTSLRIRKLFRGWLTDFATIEEHQSFIDEMLECKDINIIWKDEILLTIISTEKLRACYNKITLNMAENNYALLKKTIFLINTCCRVAEHAEVSLNKGNMLPLRLSKPSGYAWASILNFINDNKDKIIWDQELVTCVVEILDSWTKVSENQRTENTGVSGNIALYLLEEISASKEFRYEIKKDYIEKLKDILLNSAWMIKDQLCNIFQTVINGINDEEEPIDPIGSRRRKPDAPKLYIDLAEKAISDIYHYGKVPYAMPEMTLELMKKLWLRHDGMPVYYNSIEMNGYFGLNEHLSYDYYPTSAFKTPIWGLLQANQMLATEFVIDFCNKAGDAYKKSHLNIDYGECFDITICVGGQSATQTASTRLWQMYRGSHVGPNLLVSLLMGFESWLLNIVKISPTNTVEEYCQYILCKSKNVMLTAIIVSIAEAYPEKMLDIVCDLIKTKEIFHLDSIRFSSERTTSFALFKNDLFSNERKESNEFTHRKIRLEDVILKYQTDRLKLSEEDFAKQREKIFVAIDEATVDIDTWRTEDKYAYYKMDLRRYNEVTDVNIDNEGHEVYTIAPAFTEDMKLLSKESQEASDFYFKYADLQCWSNYKFNHNEKFMKYAKYSDTNVICKELGEVWELLSKTHTDDSINNDDKWLAIHRYVSIASYTSAVLLRDYFGKLEQKEQELCKLIVFSLGKMFTEASRYEVVQAGNGVEAIIVGLITLISENNRHLISGDNPLYLLLKLILIDWSDDSCIINQISSNIWDYEKQYGWQFLYAFSLIAEQYEKEIKKNRDISINDFFGKNKKLIKQALDKEVSNYSDIDFKQLSIPIMFVIILMIPFKIKEASLVAELTKDIAMKITFNDKNSAQEKYGNIYGYIFNYTMWFADVLLHCDNQDRIMLVNSFLERADFVGNNNVEYLLKWLIQEQEIHGKVNEFWSVWEALKPKMLELSHEKDRYYYTDYNGPIGKDRVIASYLFANSEWRENIYRCTLLSEERKEFFDDFIAHTGSFKAVLYSVARLLNTVGKEPYFEKGIQWIYNLIQKDPECGTKLYMKTLYYLEEYVGNFVASHRNDFRVDIVQAQRTQAVLEYMVSQGSHIAFFIREEI